ncbi:MAG: hypothetical protein DWQ48_07985, partial [Bacteroidetes bacterium]
MKNDNYTTKGSVRFYRWMLFSGIMMAGLFTAGQVMAQMTMTRSIFTSTYTPVGAGAITITGGTATNNFTNTSGVSNVDDGAAHILMPFTFIYQGTTFTEAVNHFGVNTNGYIYLFNGTNTNANKVTTGVNNLSSGTTRVLAPWWDDLQVGPVNGITGTVKYEVTGTSPNRVLTVEWGNYPAYFSGSVKALNFQVKIYENGHATMSNVIEFWYGSVSNTGSTPNQFSASESASIGIKNATGGTNNYIDAITGSTRLTNGMMNSHQFPKRNFRFTPGSPSAIAGGTYTVGNGGNYATLSGAVADINHRGISGAVTLSLIDAIYDTTTATGTNIFPILLGPVAGNSASNTITIQPASGTSTLTYRGTTSTSGSVLNDALGTAVSTSTEPIFGLVGTDYVTLNNVNLVQATGAGTNIAGVRRGLLVVNSNATDGATNNTFSNIGITLSKSNVSTAIMAIQQNVVTTPTSAAGANSSNKYMNLNIPVAAKGIELLGNASFPDLNCEIGNTSPIAFNSIGSASDTIGGTTSITTQGIRVLSQSGVKIYNNYIRNVISQTAVIDGIFLDIGQGVCSIYNNKIEGVRNYGTASTSSVYGIRSNLATTGTHEARVYNNFVSNVTHAFSGTATNTRYVRGIMAQGNGSGTGSFQRIEFNSVRIQNDAAYTGSSACYEIGTTSGVTIITRNNIFADFSPAQTGAARHTTWQSTATASIGNTGSVSDYNNLYVANMTNGFVGIGNTTTYTGLSDWQSAMSSDANSKNVDPAFVSSTDLHSNAPSLNGAADPAYTTNSSWVTTDIDNQVRGGATDIGADEFTPSTLDMGPTALVSPAATGCYTNNHAVTVTIRNFAAADVDFSANNTTVTAVVSGAVSQTLTLTLTNNSLNPGGVPLAAGASMNVTLGNLDMSTIGTYNFAVSTAVTGDGNAGNDNLTPSPSRTVSAVVAGTASAFPTTICASGGPTLSLSGHSAGSSIVWESSATSGSGFSPISGGTTNPFNAPAITSTTYYRAVVTCGGTATTSEIQVNYVNPLVASTTGGTRCGTGTVQLQATAGSGGTLKWYAAATGGAPLATGPNFTTPTISSTTNFYVGEFVGVGSSGTQTIGAGTVSNTLSTPYKGFWGGHKVQMLYTAAELTAAGLQAGGSITDLGFNIAAFTGPYTFTGFTISMKHTSLTTLSTTTHETGLTTVLAPTTYTLTSTGANTHAITPFVWNGVSNIVVETCFNNNDGGGVSANSADVSSTSVTGSVVYISQDNNATVCANAYSSTTATRPNLIITYLNGCEGTRSAVTATVTTPPAISLTTGPTTICANQSTTLSVSSSNANYVYQWSSAPAGFNATGTGPHTVSPTANITYTVSALDTTIGSPDSSCATTASVAITVNPIPVAPTITPTTPITLCEGQSTTLSSVVPTRTCIKITEIVLFRTGTGSTNPYPAYATGADLLEISNLSSLPVDISGDSLIVVGTGARTYVFPSGVVVPANGFITVCIGTGTDDAINRYYNTGGTNDAISSGTSFGVILKNNVGGIYTIYDVIAVNSQVVVGSNGVTASDWSGSGISSVSGSCGAQLTGADLNSNANWTPTTSLAGTIGTYNTGLPSCTPPSSSADWTSSPAGFTASGATVNTGPVNVTTTFIATVTGGNGCTNSSSKLITVNPLASQFSVTGGGTMCAGDPGFSIGLSGSQTGVNYQLVLNGTTNIGSPLAGTGSALDFGVQTAAGTYTVSATTTTTPACTNNMTGSATIIVNPLPTATVSGGGTVCDTQTNPDVTITLTGTAPWDITIFDGSSSSTVNGIASSPYVISAAAAGTYTVTSVLDANSCSNTGTGSATVTVITTVPVSVTINASANNICAGTNVTFTASPVNGGASPTYQWKVNGTNVGTNSDTYSSSTLADNDQVTCELSSSLPCVSGNPATSNAITMTVFANSAVSVSISESANNICAGDNVTFTAVPTNGGLSPSYQWQVNGTNVGLDQDTYSSSSLSNGDVVTCILTSSITCTTGNPATSNSVVMAVNPILNVSVSITADPSTSACTGESVAFLATPVNGGSSPSYQWQVNGTNVGTNSALYVSSTLNDGDVVTCILTSNAAPCAVGSPATSNALTMSVSNSVPVSVSISTTATTICDGQSLTFTSAASNEGTSPFYNWQVNGVDVNEFDPTFTTSSLQNGDVVRLILESSLGCATNNPDTSNEITITVVANLPVSVSIAASANPVCAGDNVTFTAIPTNGGSTPTYQWKVNGFNVGTNSNTYSSSTLTSGDLVTCVLTSSETCTSGNPATSNTVSMTVNPLPNATITPSGPTTFCVGGSVTLTAEPGLTYLWSPGNETSQSILVTTGGTYSLQVTDANNCTNTNSTNVIVSDYPTASISGDTDVCPSGTAVLTANATAGSGTITSYQWVLNGTTNVGTNSATYSTTSGGSFTVVVTNQYGCSVTSAAHVVTGLGAMSGTYTVSSAPYSCSNFNTIASAVQNLNTRGLAGNVIIDVAAGHSETAPAGGVKLDQCGLASGLKSGATQTITIKKSGAGANPVILAPVGTGTVDFIFGLIGADYVTIDAIDVAANPANTTATTQAEYGYMVVKCSATDGSNNNIIRNCAITLNKTNTNGSFGIIHESATHSPSALTFIGASSADGTNSNNKYLNNTISNAYSGIWVNGFADATPFAFYDQNNEIGASGMGNNISNLGGLTGTVYGIITQFQNNVKIVGNTVNTGANAGTGIIRGIQAGVASNANTDILNNTVTIQASPSAASQVIALSNFSGSRAGRPSSASIQNTVNIKNNTITGCTYPATGTNDLWLMFIGKSAADSLSAWNMNIEGNQIVNNTSSSASTTGTLYGILHQVVVDSSRIVNNNISNNTMNGNGGHRMRGIITGWAAAPAYLQKIYVTGNTLNNNSVSTTTGVFDGIAVETYTGASPVVGSTVDLSGNSVTNMNMSAHTTGVFTGIITSSSTNIAVNINNNTVSNITRNAATTGGFNGIRQSGATPLTLSMTGNTCNGNTTTNTAATLAFVGIQSSVSSTTISTVNISGNTVSGNILNGTGTMTLLDGGACLTGTYNSNTVNNNQKTGASGSLFSMRASTGQWTVNGNNINNNSIPASSGTTSAILYGYYNFGSPTVEIITNNQINNLSIGGSNTSTGCIVNGILTNTTSSASKTISGNTIHTLSSTVPNQVYGIAQFLGSSVDIRKNKIYNLVNSSNNATVGVYGIHIGSGNVNVYNNIIGDLRAEQTANLDAVRGISSASTTATTTIGVYNNTIRLQATSTGTNFGTSGIFHTTSTTATTATLDMRNNIIVNLSTPNGTGKTAAYRRSSTTLTNFGANSNRNIFYAGTPSTARVLFFDGTNFDDNIAAYKTRVSPREANSFTENVTFQSIISSDANFLKVDLATPTFVEGAASVVTSPAITDDYFGTTRSTSTPDIGAHEDNFIGVLPVIANVVITPSGNQCTSSARTVTCNVTSPISSTITSVMLFWQPTGGALDSVAMTNTGGSAYSGNIPAKGDSIVSWYIRATDSNPYTTQTGVSTYQDAYLKVTATAVPTSACAGTTVTLTASSPQFPSLLRITEITQFRTGSGSTNPYPAWVGAGDDLLEISNLGSVSQLTDGVIMEMYVGAALNRSFPLPSRTMASQDVIVLHLGTGTDDAVNGFYNTGGTSNSLSSGTLVGFVLRSASGAVIDAVATNGYIFPAAAGVTASDWSGAIPSNSSRAGSSLTVADNNNASNWVNSNTGGPFQSVGTYNAGVATIVPSSSLTVTWSDGGSFSASGTQVTSDPITANTTYTVTLSDGTCNSTSSVNITMIPIPNMPSANPSTQCGTGLPAASVSSNNSPSGTFLWYSAQTGGTLLQTGGTSFGTPISSTTSFWVSELINGCESPRVEVVATVTAPPAVSINVIPPSICIGDSVSFKAVTGNTLYSFLWSGDAGLGLLSTSGDSVRAVPSTTGTLNVTVFADDGTCQTFANASVSVNSYPPTPVASANPGTVCAGSSSTLSVVTSVSGNLGTGTTTQNTAYGIQPYTQFYEGAKTQYLILASELSALGFTAGNIQSIAFNVTAIGTVTVPHTNYTIKMGHTAVTDLSSAYVTSGLNTVYGPVNYVPFVGSNLHTFSTPFNWNGTSNVIVDICFDNDPTGTCTGGSGVCYGSSGSPTNTYTATAFTSVRGNYGDASSARDMCNIPTGTLVTSPNRPNMLIQGASLAGTTITWSDGSTIVGTGTPLIVTPGATTTYTAVATNAAGCSSTSNAVTVTVSPVPPAPSAFNSSQCGTGVPTCSTSTSGFIMRWYLTPTGGTPLAGESGTTLTSYSISTTTTFYVSEFDGTCESARTAVTATVVAADPITITGTPSSVCPGEAVTLTSNNNSGPLNYTYTWNANPVTGSGMPSPVVDSTVIVTPTLSGTFRYIVTANDAVAGCTVVDSVTITVKPRPVISGITISPSDNVCAGTSVTLTAVSTCNGPGSASVGNGTLSNGAQAYPAPYGNYYWGARHQMLIKAADMTAAGFAAGNLNSITLDNSAINAAPALSGFSISMKLASLANITSFQTGMTQVFTAASYTPVNGLNTHTFSTPFAWNGTSDIVVEICFNNSGWVSNGNASTKYTTTAYTSVIWGASDAAGVCAATAFDLAGSSSNRPNMAFNGTIASTGACGLNWVWNPGSVSGNVLTVNPGATTTYTVTATDPVTLCTTDSSRTINIISSIPTPAITASTNLICNSGSVTLNYTNPVSGVPVQWQNSNDGLSWTNISGANGTSYNVTLSASRYFRLYAGCTGSTDTSNVEFVQVDVPTVSASGVTRCGPGPVTLTATSNGTVEWYAASTGGTALATGTTYSPVVSATTTYYVQASIGSCVNAGGRVAVTVTVNTAPSVSIAVSPSATICNGSSVTLTASSTNDPNYTYNWSVDQTNVFATGAVQTVSPTANTTYYVYAVDSSNGANHGCAFATSQAIIVNPAPAVPVISPANPAVCSTGGSTTLTVSNAVINAGNATLGTQSSASSTGAPYRNGLTSGTRVQYLFTASELSSAGITAGNLTSLGFNVISAGSGSIDLTIGLKATASASLATSFETGTFTTVFTTTGYTVTSGQNTHTFSTPFYWNGTSNIVVNVCQVTAVTGSSPTIAMSNSTGRVIHSTATSPCSATTGTDGTIRPVTTFGYNSSQTYTWNPGGMTGASVSVSPTSNTTYTVTAQNVLGCTSSSSVLVVYEPVTVPTITPSGPTTFCPGGSVTLDAGAGYTTYSWSDGSSVVGSSQTLLVSPSATTTYTVTVRI